MINVIMPMAGEGKRFVEASYAKPKPIVEVDGLPMFARVLDNLGFSGDERKERLSIVVKASLLRHCANTITEQCRHYFIQFNAISVEETTQGAACTVLVAESLIDNNDELLIVNCDQLILQPDYMQHALDYWRRSGADGGVLCFYNDYPQWSYVNMDRRGWIRCVVEKQVVSNFATVGIYWYRSGKDFVRCAKKMIEVDDRTNGEFYIAPVYNHYIKEGEFVKVLPYLVNEMYGLGTPEMLEYYLRRKK